MKIGELFAGYGGLGMGVQAVMGGDIAWVSDIDPGANQILAHRFPDVPNHGDVSRVDWSAVEPVDVLTGGFPCQDVSAAGKRAGIRPGTRSGLWTQFAFAISQLRPRTVVIENVRGLLSARAHSDVEPCPWCVGDQSDGAMRALGAVLGDLVNLGYDAQWQGLRAADVGAPHPRFRIFVVATDTRSSRGAQALEHDGCSATSDHGASVPDKPDRDVAWARPHGGALALMPTPRATDGPKGGPTQAGSSGDLMLPSAVQPIHWAEYAPAVARWERVMGRPAPEPTIPGRNNPQLSARFVEWMMGLPEGWVTDVPGITRNQALKALGNGVVPQQAAAALRTLL